MLPRLEEALFAAAPIGEIITGRATAQVRLHIRRYSSNKVGQVIGGCRRTCAPHRRLRARDRSPWICVFTFESQLSQSFATADNTVLVSPSRLRALMHCILVAQSRPLNAAAASTAVASLSAAAGGGGGGVPKCNITLFLVF